MRFRPQLDPFALESAELALSDDGNQAPTPLQSDNDDCGVLKTPPSGKTWGWVLEENPGPGLHVLPVVQGLGRTRGQSRGFSYSAGVSMADERETHIMSGSSVIFPRIYEVGSCWS